nr:N-acetylmuramoyl-L-alanine amidase [Oceanobacillus timonensis]
MAKIYLDPGHGGTDPGAVANGLQEKALTLSIALKVRNILNRDYTGHSIRMSRTTDKTVSLAARTNDANSWGADYFVSIHINAGGGTGYEDYIYNGSVSNNTVTYRDRIHEEVMKQVDFNNRGKKRANLHVLRQSSMPGILTENGFIDTTADANKLKSDAYLDRIALGHANGIAKALGLSGGGNNGGSNPDPSGDIDVDGKWGNSTTRALQEALNTPVDGFISKQPRNAVTQALYGTTVQFGSGGSNVIVALQEKLGVNADGKLGPATIKALQKYLGTTQDGVLSRPSMVVEEMQRRLNTGTF